MNNEKLIQCANQKLAHRPIENFVAEIQELKQITGGVYLIGFNYPWNELGGPNAVLKEKVGAAVLTAAEECNSALGYAFDFTVKSN